MPEASVVYAGFITMFIGLLASLKAIGLMGIHTRWHGMALALSGIAIALVGLSLPARESRIGRVTTRMDEFVPAWQFNEFHSMEMDASPARAFEAMRAVTADEILLFRALTWIRRGGRQLPESILNAGKDESLIDVATRSGFLRLVEDTPRELVIGTVVRAPRGARGKLTPDTFRTSLPSGFALASMNFVVTPRAGGGSLVTTETRVFANSSSARRGFARYWRVIYPGSALIRRMWLRAIKARAEALPNNPTRGPEHVP